MQPAEKLSPSDVFLKEHLLYVITKAEAGEYADAMAALQETLATAKDNVYVRAVEQQLVNLLDLSRRNALTDERKAEILEPITSIVERILSPQAPGAGFIGTDNLPAASKLDSTLSPQEKVAALDRLKVNYFERAGQHLTNGDYAMALAEIRRVFVIEQDNPTAKQYESVILELMKLKGTSPSGMQPTITVRSGIQLPIVHRTPVAQRTPLRLIRPTARTIPGEKTATEPVPPVKPDPAEPVRNDVEIPPLDPAFTFSTGTPPPFRDLQSEARHPRRTIIIAAALFLVGAAVVTLVLIQKPGEAEGGESGTITSTAAPQEPAVQSNQVITASNTQTAAQPAPTTPAQSRPAPVTPQKTQSSQPSTRTNDNGASLRPDSPEPLQLRTSDVAPVSDDAAPPTPSTTPARSDNSATVASETSSVAVNEPSPEAFVAYEKEPQVVQLVRPEIPDNAWLGATVKQLVVRVMIDSNGKPRKMIFLKGDIQPVENAVTAAMMKSTFTPGIMGKSAVTTWLTVPLNIRRQN